MQDLHATRLRGAETETTSDRNTDRLLLIARKLGQELQPHRRSPWPTGLDDALDREWGFDSLSRTELLLRVERTFHVRLGDELLAAGNLRVIRDALVDAGVAPSIRSAKAPSLPAGESAPPSVELLTEVLDWHVERHGDRRHLLLLRADGRESPLTYAELATRAQAAAGGLIAAGVEPGDRVTIMLPTGMEFFIAFFGVLYAGAVPVPIYPPARASRIEEHFDRQAGILRNAGATLLIVGSDVRVPARLLAAQVESLRHPTSVASLEAAGARHRHRGAKPTDTALLQYTSGSTADPKGVVLSHANLLANIRAIGAAMEARPSDVFVSWLPLYHDMGLIGAWLGTLYYGAPLVIMSPLTFLVRPEQWLWAMHQHRATLSAAPNFAFELCLRKVEDAAIEGLDLSSVRMIANGAETVSPDTIRRFAQRFSRHGFGAAAMAPVYGLAENAVGLTFPPRGRAPVIDRIRRSALECHGLATPVTDEEPDAVELVACGQPVPRHHIRVVDAGGELPERQQGKLQFRGPSATRGYFAHPEATRELFDGDWLNTGDLAYIAGGDLYLTGRAKDVIIRAGRHLHPQPIEAVVSEVPGIRRGCVIVLGVRDQRAGTERAVVVAETTETDEARRAILRKGISAAATAQLESPPDDVVLVGSNRLPKTSSGKLRRAEARRLYETGGLDRPRSPVWRQLARLALKAIAGEERRFVRAAVARLYAVYWWIVLGLLAAFTWPAVVLAPGGGLRWRLVRAAARFFLWATRLVPKREGRLPESGSMVIAANHASHLDSLVLAALLPGEPVFVAKTELSGQFFAGRFLRALGALFVDRRDIERGVAGARQVARACSVGQTPVFFPEGTFTRAPGVLPFRLGAFLIAAQQRVSVLPIALRGTRSVLRADQWLPRHAEVVVSIGAPVPAEGADFSAVLHLRDKVRDLIVAGTGEPDLADA